MSATDPTTPAARALLRWATDEAAYWDGVATDPDPLNSLLRKGAESRRDQLDAVVARLRTALPEVEREAVAIAERTDELMQQAIEGVPV